MSGEDRLARAKREVHAPPPARRPRRPSTALFGLLIVVACADGSEEPRSFVPATATIRFEDVTMSAGITYRGETYGASWGDLDGDGYPEIWAAGHAPLILYKNHGDGTFTNVGPEVVTWQGGDKHGAAWADFDNDGDQDLYVLNGADSGRGRGPNDLLVNTDGFLVDRAAELGLQDPLGRGRTPCWLDYDGDGRLDLIVNNARRADVPTRLMRQTDAGFVDVTAEVGMDVPGGSEFSLLGYFGQPSVLHVGFGTPILDPIYALEGGALTRLSWFREKRRGDSDAVFADLDGDLDLDLVRVYGKLMPTSALVGERNLQMRLRNLKNRKPMEARFRCDGEVTFEMFYVLPQELTPGEVRIGAAGSHPDELVFTLSPAEPSCHGFLPDDPEGRPGVLIGFDPEEGEWRLRLDTLRDDALVASITGSAPITDLVRIDHEPYRPSSRVELFFREGERFVDRSERAGIDGPINPFSIAAGDFDNDMDVDLYVMCSGWVVNEENLLLLNRGDGTFDLARDAAGAAGNLYGTGDTATTGDYDVDGFLDLFLADGRIMTSPKGSHQLFRNLGNANHWLQIDLEGVRSNRDGLGARVVVRAGGKEQLRVRDNGHHNRAQNHKRLHFGLGPNTVVELITVEWPSGVRQELRDVPADQVLRIVEGD